MEMRLEVQVESRKAASQRKILAALRAADELTYTDLLKLTGLSRPVLSAHLDEMEELELIRRRPVLKENEWPPSVYYSLTEKGVEELAKRQEEAYIAQSRLKEKEIPMEVVEEVVAEVDEELDKAAVYNSGFFSRLKMGLRGREEHDFLRRVVVLESVKRRVPAYSIKLVYPEGSHPPQLNRKALKSLVKVLEACSSTGEEFKIILSYMPEQESPKEERIYMEYFPIWLMKFKGEVVDQELLPYVTGKESIENIKDKAPESLKDRLLKLYDYAVEYYQKIREYIEAVNEGYRKLLNSPEKT